MRTLIPLGSLCLLFVASFSCPVATADESWELPAMELAPNQHHPALACTAVELDRLRTTYQSQGAARRVLEDLIQRADRVLETQPEFPPRGGQHNQWYQCEACQTGLRTIDDTHHQCPNCEKIYTGEPYDDVIFSRQHGRNLQNMVTAAWAYAITGESVYAEWAKQVLLGYAERYQSYPYHAANLARDPEKIRSGGHLFEQTLNEASSLARTIGPAYDLIHDWDGLSDDEHERIRSGLLLPMLENIARNKSGKSNWQTWHNAAFMWGGGVLGDSAWIRRAIEDPQNGLVDQMNVSVTDDGMWYENSWGYHFYTLSAMIEIAETARRLNIDLWSHPRLKKMFTVALDYQMPNGRFPRFGDDTDTSLAAMADDLEFAYQAYREPDMLPYLPTKPTLQSIMFGRTPEPAEPAGKLSSALFPAAGHAILRTGGKANLAAVLTFGPYGGFHGHFDKLSFVFFGYGQELGYDPGRARSQAYRLPIHRDWYKATIGHNCVLVDGQSQQPAAGSLVSFVNASDFAAAVADCRDAYPGVEQRRLLCLTPDYLVVCDTLQSQTSHRFDWFYHNRARKVDCPQANEAVERLAEEYPGQEYLQHLRQGTVNEMVRVLFPDDALVTEVFIAPSADSTAGDTTVTIGDGVGGSVMERIPLALATRHGSQVQFAAAIVPHLASEASAVTAISLHPAPDGSYTIRIERGESVDLLTLDAEERPDWKRGTP